MRTFNNLTLASGVLTAGLLFQPSARCAETADLSKATLTYIGSSSEAGGKGIYLFRLQSRGTEVFQNVTLVPLGMAAETPNPSFFEIDLKRRLLFAVNEVDDGAVSAFATDPATGKLTLLNKQPSKGKSPCHLALAPDGRNLLVTNCGSGSVAVLPVAADGKLGEATDVVQPAGEGGSVQGVTLDPAGRFAFVGALGLDKVMSYRLDAAKGKLTPNEPAFVATGEKTGPRQLVFRPDGKFAYVINELNSTISAFAYDAETGALTELQNLSTVPGYFDGANITADIQMHSSGKYVFVSNDGHNSVVLFTIDKDKGELNWVEEQGTGGVAPRHFGIEPSGGHLAISNQGSDKVLASRIDGGNGRLKPSGIFAEMPSPACVRFLPPVGSAEKPAGED
jgi:6-phosphogluconolactonase